MPAPLEDMTLGQRIAVVSRTSSSPDLHRSSIYAGFRLIARFHRLIGGCFLQNLKEQIYENVKSNRLGWYTTYTIILWCILLGLGMAIVVKSAEFAKSLSELERLNIFIFLLFIFLVIIEAIINNVIMLINAPAFIQILHSCADLEAEIRLSSDTPQKMVGLAKRILLFQAVLSTSNLCLNLVGDSGALLVKNKAVLSRDFLSMVMVFSFLGVILISCLALISKVWLLYFASVFQQYFSCINSNMGRCFTSSRLSVKRKVFLLDDMKHQLWVLGRLVQKTSKVLGPGVLYSYGYSVGSLCVATYYTVAPHLNIKTRLFFACSGAFHGFSILLPTMAAHSMKNEVLKLRTILQSVRLIDVPDSFLKQLELMLLCVDKNDIKFSGCGFFTVELPVLVSIMGAVITYTVVLVQTNDSLKGKASYCICNMTV